MPTSPGSSRSGPPSEPGGETESSRDGADLRFLRACLDLALLGEGETSPNPMVGALIVREGRILGQGYHRRAGDRHAEIAALEEAGAAARGSTLFVNLEPCVHFGRTPPCVEAIIDAGVAEVVAAMQDPDPRVNGNGFARLSAAGVRVRTGLLASEAGRLNERFIKYVTTGIPFVTLKAAMTLDGRIAAASGESRWITSETAREEAHRIRYAHDALLVGINTVLRDDPSLTARRGVGKPLVRAVLDSELRIPTTARLLSNLDGGRTILYTLSGVSRGAFGSLGRLKGVEVCEVEGKPGALDWKSVLKDLGSRGVGSVLVEGGGRILGSALAGGIADRIAVFIAPKILGGSALPAFAGFDPGGLAGVATIREWTCRNVGPDLLVEGILSPPEAERE